MSEGQAGGAGCGCLYWPTIAFLVAIAVKLGWAVGDWMLNP